MHVWRRSLNLALTAALLLSIAPAPRARAQEAAKAQAAAVAPADLDAKLAEIGDEAQVTLGPLDMGGFIEGMLVAWITDPEGYIVELNQGYEDETTPPPLDR